MRGNVNAYPNLLLSILPLQKKACLEPTPVISSMPALLTTAAAVTLEPDEKTPSIDDIFFIMRQKDPLLS